MKIMIMTFTNNQALLRYNNFHTLMAFLSAFNNSAVLRLKWTRERLPGPAKKVFKAKHKNTKLFYLNYILRYFGKLCC